MCAYRKLLVLLSLALFTASYATVNLLTPPHEPKDDSFYVCYLKCRINYTVHAPMLAYKKFKYMGCMISKAPCDTICVKNPSCHPAKLIKMSRKPCVSNCVTKIVTQITYRPVTLKSFGWFNNYPQALNAFYRCAYS
ncbi:MAG: hypothetical protein A3F46_00230 [Legionellales bacterium RIFCSPHIGHO2_12_FULL_42_9]|nr:MAG: hypothetical protein A3F46_00230 [Legionellales bacterium RIFCSPHIGHO2_12_FULL_42_9]